ncbi:amino acid permease [Rhizobium leguminosarum]|uniref:amino acid permease n=1 Tax=Rhizobium leguminosarum TaxID=384 RepID=UPI0015D98C71|nr:amino acid permease [Rhizobium leguminosarum]
MNSTTAEAAGIRPRLARTLTLSHAVLYGLGVTIGAGIYVLVGVAAGRAGMHAPLAFLGAAAVMGLSAASFAELGTRMPVSASEAAYVDRAFRLRWFTILTGLLVIVTAIISAATISAGSAGYVGVLLPLPGSSIIAGVVLTMAAISCLATASSITFAGVMTLIEVGGLLLIVGAGFSEGVGLIERLPEAWPGGNPTAWVGVFGTAMIAVFSFIGFEHLVNIAEEMKTPSKTLPRALFVTLGLTAVIYAGVTWVAVVTVPPDELARSPAPLALVFERLTGMPLVTMSAIAIIATLNGIIVHMIMISRVIYGLVQQGNLPQVLGRLNPHTGTPIVATLIGATAILVFAIFVPLVGLAKLTSQCTLGLFTLVNLALIRIKMTETTALPPGVFICPFWVPVAGVIASAALLVIDVALIG